MAKPLHKIIEESSQSPVELDKHIETLKFHQAAQRSREHLMDFIKFTMPDPEFPKDVDRSRYENARHHDAIVRAVEKVEEGEYQFLILTVPPRHGKSEIVSRRLPAWFLGKHPEQNVVVATYNDDFAKDFGADVRSIVTSPEFRLVFPEVRLKRGGSAKDRLQTTAGGMATFVGVGGSLTGRGAHCFPAGTLVETTEGPVRIENLKDCAPSVQAVCCDIQTGQIRTRPIEAFAHRKATRLLRITTVSGRVVEATPDHPFFTPGGYVEAAELTPGDCLVRLLSEDRGEAGIRDREERSARADALLLLERMLGPGGEREAPRAAEVRSMRGACAAGREEGVLGQHVLLHRMPENRQESGEGQTARGTALENLRRVRGRVPAGAGAGEVSQETRPTAGAILRDEMREQGTRPEDAGAEEPCVPAWAGGYPEAAACGARVPGSQDRGAREGWVEVRDLRRGREAACAPHQHEPAGQSLAEPDHALRQVSQEAPRGREVDEHVTIDTVLRVDEVPVGDGGVEVYDIQVAEDHNFFANGVLVHNCLIIDDLIKSYEEARSQAFRDRAWDWFTKVAMSRRMGKKLVIITFTRWHTDDIIGRLTDPENEHYSREIAKKIKIIDIPAIAFEDDDPLGRAPGEALWPEWYGLDFLEEQRNLDPLGFEALYQQRPTVADGILFRRENVRYYGPDEPVQLPPLEDLRIYCASDHAVATDQRSDFTVLLKVGLDQQNNIYLLDCWWRKARTDVVVEAMLTMGGANPKPLIWWAEKGHISKSIGPFLRKRMSETQTYFNVSEVTPAGDKEQRAQSISARMAMGHVFFPKEKNWCERAINELLAFPNGLHDDFVDTFSYIGLGLRGMFPVKRTEQTAQPAKYGTFRWVKEAQKAEDRRISLLKAEDF